MDFFLGLAGGRDDGLLRLRFFSPNLYGFCTLQK